MYAPYQGPPIVGYGPSQCAAFARFQTLSAVNGLQPMLDNFGIKSISRTATGIFTVTLSEKLPTFLPYVNGIVASTLNHDYPITAYDASAGTFEFKHFSSAANRTTTASVADDGLVGTALVTFQIFVFGRSGL